MFIIVGILNSFFPEWVKNVQINFSEATGGSEEFVNRLRNMKVSTFRIAGLTFLFVLAPIFYLIGGGIK